MLSPALARARLGRLAFEQIGIGRATRAVDVVHLPNPHALLLSSAPFVVTVHDVFFLDRPEWYPRSFVVFKRAMLEATLARSPRVVDPKGKARPIARKQISYKYRGSNLENLVVLEAKLALIEEPPAKLKELQGKLLRWRKAGTPFDQPCCGSVFKNPGGARTAGALIDECGLKGFTIGGAQVSTLHANYIVNTGNATASDVLRVIDHVRKTVAKKTGVELELEVRVIGV